MRKQERASRSEGTRPGSPSHQVHGPAESLRRGDPATPAGGPSPIDQVLLLQRKAGNRAVVAVVQADRAAGGPPSPAPRPRDASARLDAFMADYPGIAHAMSLDQLSKWRDILAGYQANTDVDEALKRQERDYRATAWDPNVPFIADSRYQDRRRRIEDRRQFVDERAGWATLDPARIIGPDVSLLPEWNVAAESRFRDWAVTRLSSLPLTAELTNRREIVSQMQRLADPGLAEGRPHVNLWWGKSTIDHTKGIVTFADMLKIREFGDKYRDQVSNGPEVQALRKGINELRAHLNSMMAEHQDLSDRNRGAEYDLPVQKKIRGAVRHISEGLGAPSSMKLAIAHLKAQGNPDDEALRAELMMLEAQAGAYPKLHGEDGIWYKPVQQLEAAERFFADGQIEISAGALSLSEQSSAQATIKFAGYERRVMSGAGVAVKWLERAKTAGKIASAFTGTGGILRAAASSAGYTFAQEGAQEVSTAFFDPSHKIGWKRVAQQSAIDGLMSLFGGLTQGAFTKALSARFSTRLVTDWGLSATTAQKVLDIAGATTSSFYNVPAQIVLDRIIAGKALPKSLADVADMVTTEAASSMGMEVIGGYVQAVGARGKGADDPARPAAETAAGTAAAKDPTAKLVEALAGRTPAVREGPAPAPGRALPPGSSGRAVPPVTAEARKLAAELEPLRVEWASLKTADARAQRLLDVVYRSFAHTGLPAPKPKPKDVIGGHLDPNTWEIAFEKKLLEVDNITPDDFAGACGLMRHEMEHALQWFRMARQEAAGSRETPKELATRLGIPVKEVASAIEANTGQRPAEDMSPGSPAAIVTRSHYESVYGTQGAQHRNKVLVDLEVAWGEFAKADADLKRVKGERPDSLLYQAAVKQWYDVRAKHQPTVDAYHALPEEIGAYRASDELTQAVREQGVITRLDRARLLERQAHATLAPLEELAASVRDKPGHTLALDTRRAFNKALGDWMTGLQRVRRIESELLALRKKVTP